MAMHRSKGYFFNYFREVGAAFQGSHLIYTAMGGTGCWSYVGRQAGGRGQRINLGSPRCVNVGTVIHETLHALGWSIYSSRLFDLFLGAVHEQSRPDRDLYVNILWANIKTGKEHNFNKTSNATHSGRGTPFDPESIMIYGPKNFGKDDGKGGKETTIQPLDPNVQIK